MKPIMKRGRIRFLYSCFIVSIMALLLIPLYAVAKSVEDFGAFPDDGIDDRSKMQDAANYLCQPEHQGETLVFPPGTYNLDKTVDHKTFFDALGSGKLNDIGIFYNGCQNVKIVGEGAKIEVNGNFIKKRKTDSAPISGLPYYPVDTMAFNPFIFRDSYKIEISGFEIDGNVDQMKQDVPEGFQLQEAYETGIFIVKGGEFNLHDLFIHHMASDGVLLDLARDVEIHQVTLANNIRNALAIGQGRNIVVTDSRLIDTGVVGTAPNSYPGHSPGRGVAIEPECYPKDAEWNLDPETGEPVGGVCDPLIGMAGNILLDRVKVTGNLGGGIGMGHGEASANVTVRNSFLQNPLGKDGSLVDMGIVGGIVENSTLDAQNGQGVWCKTLGTDTQLTSPIWASYLQDLANDPSDIAKMVPRQTDPTFSTTVQGNTILGQGTKISCENATPVMTVANNKIIGTLLKEPQDTDSSYHNNGHMVIQSGTPGATCSTGHEWGKKLTITGNDIFIPADASRGQSEGQINYCGTKLEFANNNYHRTGADSEMPLWVSYDQNVGSVNRDCFPASGSIVNPIIDASGSPIDFCGPSFEPNKCSIIAVHPVGQPHTLTPQGSQRCLTLP